MADTGRLVESVQLPDDRLPVEGEREGYLRFPLRATPRIFSLLVPGANNARSFVLRSSIAHEPVQVELAGRRQRPTPLRVDFPLYKSGSGVAGAIAAGGDSHLMNKSGKAIASGKGSGTKDMAAISFVSSGLYASLLAADRPVAWWGFDDDAEALDSSGYGYTLTHTGTYTLGSALLSHGQRPGDKSRDFNGTTDASSTAGSLYDPPAGPPTFHAASSGAGALTTTALLTPAGIEAGDLVLACLVHANNTATVSSTPSGWTQVGSTLNAGTVAVALYKHLPSQDEPPDSYTWTWSLAGASLAGVLVYRNCDANVSGLVYDAGAQATTSGSYHLTTSEGNPVQAKALALWAGELAGMVTPDPTGLRSRISISNSVDPNLKLVAAEYDLAVAGSVSKAASTSETTQLGALLVTFGAPSTLRENALDALDEHVSLHALVHPDTVAAGTRTIIRKHQGYGLQVNGATLEFVYRDGAGNDQTVSGPTISVATTTHVVVVDDGTNIRFFKNGVKTTVARVGAAGYTTNANQVTIGAYHNGAILTNFFDGRLDEVVVFAASISDQMVAAYYQAHNAGTFGTKLLGASSSYPALKLEIAFASAPTDATLVWEDVTADVRAQEVMSPTRGRNFELDRIESGRLDFTLNNRSRQYDPSYAGSPYYPNIKPTRAVRLRAQARTDGYAYPIFFGYTEGHPLLRLAAGKDSTVRFTATDAFKVLSLDKVQGSFVRPNEASGERIAALIDGMPGLPFSGDGGQSEVVGDDLIGANTLDHVQSVAETEGGVLFADARGRIVFQDRHHRARYSRTSEATYGDGGGSELPVARMEPQIDESRLYTAAAVTPASGNVSREIDPAATLDYFVRTKEVTTVHASDNDAQGMAEAYAHRYAVPRIRIPSLELAPAGHSDPAAMWDKVLSHEISGRIRTVERPIGDTSAVTREHFIEGITHEISGSAWVVKFSLSPADLDGDYWQLGSGRLGDSSGLTSTKLGW